MKRFRLVIVLIGVIIHQLMSSTPLAGAVWPDFEMAMEFAQSDHSQQSLKRSEHPIVHLCCTLYQNNNLTLMIPQKNPIIPKIIHLIWVEPHTPPDIYYSCLESINYYLPDWECKIWTDADIPSLNLT